MGSRVPGGRYGSRQPPGEGGVLELAKSSCVRRDHRVGMQQGNGCDLLVNRAALLCRRGFNASTLHHAQVLQPAESLLA